MHYDWFLDEVASLMARGANLSQCWDIFYTAAKAERKYFPKFSDFINQYSQRKRIIEIAERISKMKY